ncbi:efflux RND transporter periplasmic adaptor subunit [Sulfuricystis multivorans]|uniref:efflux RND transporter periplasmic adaptor subunit n=1 Tax=Sulfuricystis multivorans TaxID=2211108 RepID=UPI000F81C506|nr:efflux RND transporter periplasmic adaptor subunit [Sulfuricystis multivorans]
MKPRRLLALILLVVLVGGGIMAWRGFFAADAKPAYKFATVERGPLTAAVAATGTLNPVVSVQVSSQISGQIRELFVDFNSPVKAGDLLARIAPETYEHRVRQAEADLEAARAIVAVQQAELFRARVNLLEAERDFKRKETLVAKNYLSPAELDKAQTTLDAARAQLKVVQAQAANSMALVRQREAALAQARVDLSRTEIRAPVDGIVIKKSVEPGQTVAVSLQAPEMFVIARNLADMQVEAAIDEADIGRVEVGQEVSFSVDAFPGRKFKGEVRQVRKAAQVTSNVVSYTVVISAANPDLILLPGMTANVRIVTSHKDDALKVANAALRFRPPAEGDEPAPAARPGGGSGRSRSSAEGGSGKLWVLGEDGKPKAIEIRTGITDGNQIEIVGGDIAAGQQVIVGMSDPRKRAKPTQPRMF